MATHAKSGDAQTYQKLVADSYIHEGESHYYLFVQDETGALIVDLDTNKGATRTQIFTELMKWRCFLSAAKVLNGKEL